VSVPQFVTTSSEVLEMTSKRVTKKTAKVKGEPNEVVQFKKTKRGIRGTIYGQAFTAAIRWMGHNDVVPANAKKVFDHYDVPISDHTIKIQLNAGKNGQRGNPAAFTKEQEKSLLAIITK